VEDIVALLEYAPQYTAPRWRILLHDGGWRALQALKAARGAEMIGVFARARADLGDLETLRGRAALYHSIRGMCRALDPHSGLVEACEWLRGSSDESAPGLGFDVAENLGVGPLLIKNVVPGGPAQRAGIRPGDRITHVQGKAVQG